MISVSCGIKLNNNIISQVSHKYRGISLKSKRQIEEVHLEKDQGHELHQPRCAQLTPASGKIPNVT